MSHRLNNKRTSRLTNTLAVAATLAFQQNTLADILFEDEFSGSSLGSEWTLFSSADGGSAVVSGGGLNFNTGVVTGTRPSVEYALDGTGAPSVTYGEDWTYEMAINLGLASDFNVTNPGEGVGITLQVRNSLPSSGDKAQINAVGINLGSGFGHAVRGAGSTDDATVTEQIEPLTDGSSPLSIVVRVAYDSSTNTITFGRDTGTGFVGLADPFDISTWGMSASDPFDLRAELAFISTSSSDATSTFSVETGEVVLDRVTVYDEALETSQVPEPSSSALLALGMISLFIRKHRS